MEPLFIVGIILFVFSLILMVFPSLVFKINSQFSKVIFTDAEFFSHPKASGILFIVCGIVLIAIGIYIKDMVKLIIL